MTSPKPPLISAKDSVLICIDVQTRLCPAMGNLQQVLKNGVRLIKSAQALEVPIIVTEQYPQGIGPTVDTFLIDLPEGAIIEKTSFSAVREPAFMERMESSGRKQAVIFGTEAHVCVLQTALELVDRGWSVYVVKDALSSRASDNEQMAILRLSANGASVVTTEMVLFEWLEGKDNPKFKAIQALIK